MNAALHALLPPPAVLERLVYLVGPARGGTSILHAAQAMNPGALVLPGVTHFFRNVWSYRRKVHQRLLRQILYMPESWHWAAIRAALDEPGYAEFSRLISRALASGDLATIYQLYPMAYAIATGAMAERPGIACWHDKSNDWRGLDTLAKGCPRAKFIIVVRDPRSVALSGSVRLAWHSDAAPVASDPTHLVDMALYWRFMVLRGLMLARRAPDRTMVVRFEDFVSAPVPTLQRLFRFTSGNDVSEAAILAGLAKFKGGATNAPESYEGVSRIPLDRWKKALSKGDIDLVERLTAGTARPLGYAMDREGGLSDMLSAAAAVPGSAPRLRRATKALVIAARQLQVPSSS